MKLGLKVYSTNIKTQKIDGSILKIFEIVLASFLIKDKLKRARFLEKTFLLANLSIKMVLSMLFLTFSNRNIQFAKKELIYRFYTTVKAVPTIKQVKIIDKEKFIKVAINEYVEAFVVHVTFFSLNLMLIYLAWKA